MAPVPLSKATKAVLRDFYWEEIRPQPRESRAKILPAAIVIAAFFDETRRKRKTQRPPSLPALRAS
jgi:hypothetical protein